jgi:hypothetical protein
LFSGFSSIATCPKAAPLFLVVRETNASAGGERERERERDRTLYGSVDYRLSI